MSSEVISFNMDKRGISIMIGYILLITSAVVMSAIVYQWMKTYIPKDAIDCPEGVSLFVSESSCTEYPDNYQLRLTTKNNGRFDIGGYFIHATNDSNQTLATIDLTEDIISGGEAYNNAIVFSLLTSELSNFLNPNENIPAIFNVSSKLYTIEIIPVRFQVHDNKKRLVSCSEAKVIESLDCKVPEVPECIIDEECVGTEICVNEECTLCGNGIFEPAEGEQCDYNDLESGEGCTEECLCPDAYLNGKCLSS